MTEVEYVYVDPIPYIRPVHSGLLVIPPGTTQYNVTILREEHKEHLRLYYDVNNVKKVLLKKMGKDLPDMYLQKHVL